MVDGKPLYGWEFRLFKANLGVVRHGFLLEETYQCSSALYRGGKTTKFVWEENANEMGSWLHFYNADAIIAGLPKPPPTQQPLGSLGPLGGSSSSMVTSSGPNTIASTAAGTAGATGGSNLGKFAISA